MTTVRTTRKKVLQLGPDPLKSTGGMATVINDIVSDKVIQSEYEIQSFPTYRNGNPIYRFFYCVYAFLKFLVVYKKYDIFHIHIASYASTFRKAFYIKILKKSDKKVICHIHGAKYLLFFSKLSEKNKRRVTDSLNSADAVIALSDSWQDKLKNVCGLRNCVSIPNGVDVKNFEPAVSDINLHKDSFAFIGKLCERKGVYDLIKAMEKLIIDIPDIKLYLAGDGDKDKVKQLVNEHGLGNNIEIVGWLDFDGKINLLKKCSTVVLPSYNEGLPMAILEGMAAGKVIISSTVGAIPEVVKPENGLLITPGDIDALTAAMRKCCVGGGLMESISKNNVEKINREYSLRIMHSKIKKLYTQLAP